MLARHLHAESIPNVIKTIKLVLLLGDEKCMLYAICYMLNNGNVVMVRSCHNWCHCRVRVRETPH